MTPSVLASLVAPAPRVESPFDGDGLRRLVSRRYELRLVERGLAARPHAAAVVTEDDDDEGSSPLTERFEQPDAKLLDEIDTWLERVVLVDGDRRFPATSLGRAFANVWRRAGGEPPLPPSLALVSARSSAEVTARVGSSAAPPALPARAVTSATDPLRAVRSSAEAAIARPVRVSPPGDGRAVAAPANEPEGHHMSKELSPRDEQLVVAMKANKSTDEIMTALGMTRSAVYTATSRLRREGHVGTKASTSAPATRASSPQPPARKGGGRPLVGQLLSTEDELVAPLRERLAALDAKREAIVTAIRALGGEV